MNVVIAIIIIITSSHLVTPYSSSTFYDDYDEDNNEDFSQINATTNGTIAFVHFLRNVTVDDGAKSLRLQCDVENLDVNTTTNVKISFRWYINDVMVEKSKRLSVKSVSLKDGSNRYRSTLRISKVEVHDKGFYDCVATNGVDKIRTQAFVDVAASPRWSGTSLTALKFDSPSEEGTTISVSGFIGNSGSHGDLDSVIAGGLDVGPVPPGKTFDLPSTGKMADIVGTTKVTDFYYNSTQPLCQAYRGKTCAKYLADRYVFVQPSYTQSEIEDELSKAFLVISQSQDISSNCNRFAKPSLCYSAFPLCRDPGAVNRYQHDKTSKFQGANRAAFKTIRNDLSPSLGRICKDDCLLLETELCSKEYAIAKRHPVISKTLQLEECQYLPDEFDRSKRTCLSLGVDNEAPDKEDSCFWDDGQKYRGAMNVTSSGEKCLRWSHQFHMQPSEYPELTGHNYCRNPGGAMEQPFCYVDQNRKEICDVLKCANVVAMYVVASFAFVTVFFVVVIAAVCCRRKNKTRNIQNISVPSADKNIYGNHGPNSPMEMNSLLAPNIPPQRGHHSSKNGYQNVPQYTYKEVNFVEELGEGAFGKVYKGELKAATGKMYVAVKSLKENASAKTQADFQREIELISELKHPNIICLLGVVVKQEPMCMLFEFMSEGDLHEFLMSNSPSEGKSLTQNQFLHIAIQIAQGMEYLSENHYVHRDLAARNCLVSKDLVVKISDFGLSRDMYSCDYYRVQSKSLLPVRWMPPESILYGKFTTESDVWSYGVVLWEIYSYGLQPYYGYNNQEVINMIRSRKLLPCPDACPSYCYALMVECWAELAVRRPNFAEIAYRLRLWKQNGNYNGAYFKSSEPYPPGAPKSSKSSESPTVCPSSVEENHQQQQQQRPESCSATWERGLSKSGSSRLTESQNSLTSRSSSLGNRTQSTSLSTDHHHHHHHHHHHPHGNHRHHHHPPPPPPPPPLPLNPAVHPKTSKLREVMTADDCTNGLKNTMVSSSTNGDNYEIKVTK